MFKRMSLAVGTLALALYVGAGSSAFAQDQQNNQPNNPPSSSGAATQDQQNQQNAAPQGQQNGTMNGSDMNSNDRSSRRRNRDNSMRSSDMSGADVERENRIRWSNRYRLTPLEHKRLRAMGLTDQEVFGVANAAHDSGVDVDEITQMVLRGRSFFQIAEQLGIPYEPLSRRRPEWQTAEWEQGVKEGWFTHRQGMSSYSGSSSSSGTSSSGTSTDHQMNR